MEVSIAENITWKNLSTGVVLLNLESGEYFTLNETASSIWKGLIENLSAEDIANNLVAEFECELDEANADIKEYLEFLASENLITLS